MKKDVICSVYETPDIENIKKYKEIINEMIDKAGWSTPVLVNEKMEIIDGQWRLGLLEKGE